MEERTIFRKERRLTESQFLEGTAVRLGIEEELEQELEEDPAAVEGEELPAEGLHGDGVDEIGEEATGLAEYLLDANASGSNGVWEQLNKESYQVFQVSEYEEDEEE